MKRLILFVLILSLNSTSIMAQDLSKHQWKHRVLLVLSSSENNSSYQQQIDSLKTNLKGLDERKLVIYQVVKDHFKIGFNDVEWKISSSLYEQYKKETSDFEIILIGLDGGIKLRQTSFLSNKKLFGIIDVMPMRRQEINTKN